LPSSLTRAHPFALAVSCQPTCVGLRYGRSTPSRQGFSRRPRITRLAPCGPRSTPHVSRLFSPDARYEQRPPSNRRPCYLFGSPCALKRSLSGAGMWTCSPSPTPRGLGLGPTNPERIILPQEPLGLRRRRFSRRLSLLIPASALVSTPPLLPLRLLCRRRRSPTIPPPPVSCNTPRAISIASALGLIPATLSAPRNSTSELLRTLSRMAASKPTSWLSAPRDRLANLA